MPTRLEMASWLRGDREGARKVTLTTGTALADSADGYVEVDLGGDVVTGDGMQGILVPTTADVRAGDTVTAALDGADGTAKAPSVVGVVGGGDRTRTEVSKAQQAATNTAAAAAAEVTAREAAIKQVQSYIDAYKKDAAATYATQKSVDEKTGAITETLQADYTKTADLASTDAVKDAKKAGTDAQAQLSAYETSNDNAVADAKKAGTDAQAALDSYKTTASQTYVEKATYSKDVSGIRSDVSAHYQALTDYKTSNDKAVADAKSAGITAQSQLSDYKTSNDSAVAAAKKAGTDAQANLDSYESSNDQAIKSIKTDYATKTELSQAKDSLSASVSDSLTQAKAYADGQVKTEATNRDAAIEARAGAIQTTVTEQISTAKGEVQADLDAKTLVVDVRQTPGTGDADAGTVHMAATVRRGSDQLDADAIAKLGTLAWYVGGDKVATGDSYDAQAGQSVECRLVSTDGTKVMATSCQQTWATTTQLAQTATGLETSITTTTRKAATAYDLADQTASSLAGEIETRRSWFRESEVEGNPALTLGTTASQRVGRLTNDRLDFLNGDQTVASVGEHFFMQSAKVTGELLVGGFRLFPRSDGGVSVKWIGVS